jgi:hypothetical protein
MVAAIIIKQEMKKVERAERPKDGIADEGEEHNGGTRGLL